MKNTPHNSIANHHGPSGIIRPNEIKLLDAFINAHIGEKLTLDLISKKFRFPILKLRNSFQYYYQQDFRTYLVLCRMKYAIKLLEEGMPPKEVFSHIGYADHSSFYRAFKKKYGQTPSQLLKSMNRQG